MANLPFRPHLRTPFARAVVPVAGGIGLFVIIGLLLWGAAALLSNGSAKSTNLLSNKTFQPGPARHYAEIVAADGPIIFPDLLSSSGDRTIVLDHAGVDPNTGWVIRLGHPLDRPLSCKVTQVRHTRDFVDCDGRTVPVEQLAPPALGIAPDVSRDGILTLNLIAAPATTAPVTATTAPVAATTANVAGTTTAPATS